MNSNQPKIADLLRKKLNQIKIESDKNDQLIVESFELLSQIKKNQQQLESIVDSMYWWFKSQSNHDSFLIQITNQFSFLMNSNYKRFLDKMNSYQESIDDCKELLIQCKKDFKKLEMLSKTIEHELESQIIWDSFLITITNESRLGANSN